jgi:hypothetical protein
LQYRFLEKHDDIHILGGCSLIFNKTGIIREAKYPSLSVDLGWLFISNSYFCHPAVMFRSSLYRDLGGYPDEKVSEDYAYFSSILRFHRGANLLVPLLQYRVHEKNASGELAALISDFIKRKFRENYQYYVPDLRLMDEFYLFQTHKLLSPRFAFRMLFLNTNILNKIRNNYRMPVVSVDFIRSYSLLVSRLCYALWNYVKQNAGFYVRSRLRALTGSKR